MQSLNYFADADTALHARMSQYPITSDPVLDFPNMSLDDHHILHPLLDPHGDGEELEIRGLEEILDSYPAVKLDFLDEESVFLDETTTEYLNSTRNDELDSFFDDPTSHPVHENKFNYLPGEPLHSDSYVTADETF